MITYRLSLIVAVLLLVTGCGREPASEAPPPTETTTEAPPPSTPEPLGMPVSAVVEAALNGEDARILDRLAAPDSVSATPRQNRHVPGQMDTVRTHYYPGAALTTYDVTDAPDRFIMKLRVTDEAYQTDEGLRVGTSRENTEDMLGPPDQREDGTYVYELGEDVAATNLLRIAFEGDMVQRLTWSFYVD